MGIVTGSWAVEYNDGTHLAQYDSWGNEVPLKSIEWPRVKMLRLESQWVQQDLQIIQPPPGYYLKLHRRVWWNGETDENKSQFEGYVLCTFDGSKSIDPNDARTYEAACVAATYWFPSGVIHQCPHFNCPDAAHYGSGTMHGQQRSLMPLHDIKQLAIDAQLIK